MIDLNYMDIAINHLLENNLDYVDHKRLPPGTEYLTNYIRDNELYFKTSSTPVSQKHKSQLRLTIDTKKDFNFVRSFLLEMKKIKKNYNYNLDDILNFYPKSFKIEKN